MIKIKIEPSEKSLEKKRLREERKKQKEEAKQLRREEKLEQKNKSVSVTNGIITDKKKGIVRKLGISSMWGLFILAFIFAIYKNFTAINTHTVTTREVVEEKIISTEGLKTFVSEFIDVYFAYTGNTSTREAMLRNYVEDSVLTTSLSSLEMSKGSIYVTGKHFLDIKEVGSGEYEVIFSVKRKSVIKGVNGEGSAAEAEDVYSVKVYENEKGERLILTLPVPSVKTGKATRKNTILQEVVLEKKEEQRIKSFLFDFFTLYPTLNQDQLRYYVEKDSLRAIERKDLKLIGVNNIQVHSYSKDTLEVSVEVSYENTVLEVKEVWKYRLELQGGNTLKIKKVL